MQHFIRSTPLRLPKEGIERHTTWLEIFFDLIFAVIIAQLSTRLITHLNFIGVFQCLAMSIPIMWIWISYTVFAARFDNNDAFHWFMTFIIMFAIGFVIAQIALLILYFRTTYESSTPRNMLFLYMIGFGVGGLCWIISLFFEPPFQFVLWALGMSIYLVIPWLGRKRILSKIPLDPTYIPERFGSFVVIIVGQIIASVVFGLESASWHLSSILTSLMAFILAMLIWGQYYKFTQIADYKLTLGSGQPYIYAHIPLIISLIMLGGCIGYFITNSTSLYKNANATFCFAIVLYLSSLYLLQYLSICKFKVNGLSHFGGIMAVLILFIFFTFSPVVIMSIIVFIFIAIFSIQYWQAQQV